MKICKTCNISKDLKLFWKDRYTKDGYCRNCIECQKIKDRISTEKRKENRREYARKYYRANKDKIGAIRRRYRKKKRNCPKYKLKRRLDQVKYEFNLTKDEYFKLKEVGKCQICKTKDPGKKDFAIDHCHVTAKVRGILCGKCNVGLGHFNDNIKLLKLAIEYLKDNS